MQVSPPKPHAFTLLELLVVVTLVAMLSALAASVSQGALRHAAMVREVSAARQVIAGYHRYAAENDGDLLPGYGDFAAVDDKGVNLHSPVSSRYAWRLAPYLNYEMQLLWGNNRDDVLRRLSQGPREEYVYGVSVEPAFGLNAIFVGGDFQEFPPTKAKAIQLYGNFCVTKLGLASHASQLIVFASAGSKYQDSYLPGYFKVQAPSVTGRKWAQSWQKSASPNDYGFVDFRYDGKAVVAMLDGHVEMMTFDQMDDMRHWSNQAAEAGQRYWTLGQN